MAGAACVATTGVVAPSATSATVCGCWRATMRRRSAAETAKYGHGTWSMASGVGKRGTTVVALTAAFARGFAPDFVARMYASFPLLHSR